MNEIVRVCAISGQDECKDCATGTCDGLRYKAFWMPRRETSKEAA